MKNLRQVFLSPFQGMGKNAILVLHVYDQLNIWTKLFHRLRLRWLVWWHKVVAILVIFYSEKHPGLLKPLFGWFRAMKKVLKRMFLKLRGRVANHFLRNIQQMQRDFEQMERELEKQRSYRMTRTLDRKEEEKRAYRRRRLEEEQQARRTLLNALNDLEQSLRRLVHLDRPKFNVENYLL